jgi:glycosyltransferase involved in cell wall biosynthesis
VPAADPRPGTGRLRVTIDARYWRSTIQTGIERYIHLLLDALAATTAIEPSVEIGLILHETHAGAFKATRTGLDVQMLPVPDRREASLHRVLHDFGPHVVHYPFDLPAHLEHPSVFTLHDAGRYLFPELMVNSVRDVQNERLHQHTSGEHLRAVITVSHASRHDIVTALGDLPIPLTVVPNFISDDFRGQLTEARRAQSRPSLNSPSPANEPYLLAVGVYMPTKNIPRLCRAFRLARQTAPDVVPPRLLLAGRRGWERGLPTRRSTNISALGHVDDARLAALYAGADIFIFPSLFEGFGIPAQEALAAGTRVLCSDLPVFAEVTGGLASFADTTNDEALAKAILHTLTMPPPDPTAVETLLARYTPRSAGAALLDVYRSAALDSQ